MTVPTGNPAVRVSATSRSSTAAWLAVAGAMLAATPAAAQGPVELSSTPIAENPAWQSYVLGTGELTARPVRINATSGDVTNADGLVDPAKGPAKLTYAAGGRVPMIILDYGREVGGLPFFTASRRLRRRCHPARGVQRSARVPVDARQHDAVARGGRG